MKRIYVEIFIDEMIENFNQELLSKNKLIKLANDNQLEFQENNYQIYLKKMYLISKRKLDFYFLQKIQQK